ncbi:hypothetical protein [Dokdonella sp.]|uniref:hypothetical protein n=1 Tax=Dokdonella sp. TaxID=2291710 RepID=UPI0025C06A45|nr:hypothetical protein [Dokdonella sp.]MBX3690521.1 hypothetical protein [Dokdonella sp.]
MKRFHISVAVADLDASIDDYSARLGQLPQAVVAGKYAMWRTELLNFSIKLQPERRGQLCNLGIEDDAAQGFTSSTDCNGISWERFSALEQDLQVIMQFGVPVHPLPTEADLIRN